MRRLGPFTTLGAALAVGALLLCAAMYAAGTNPIEGFSALVEGALGGRNQIGETLVATTALLFPALGITLAFRAGLFNIGAEGQLIIGALFAGAIGPQLHLPPLLGIVVLFACGALGGFIWGGIAGWMKARMQANEVISTLMLNFIAGYVALYLAGGPLRGPVASGAETAWLPNGYWLPPLIAHTRLSVGIVVALCVAAALQFVLSRTVFGFELRATGEAPEAARRNGISIARITLLSLAVSGAIAGMGGAAIVTGELHRFNTQLSPGYGFTAIAVALVGNLQPLWVCVAAFGFGILEAGGLSMQASVGVPKDAVHIIEGLIIFILAARRYVASRNGAVAA
ncbi:MAG: ABC transporter permease [Candidatus Eremiobacteraeota bacterium]|nr:ABC transporter permease [Candidatus Eremiobacteraeota bacterium]